MKKVLILNGPNLNCLGRREPEIYGRQTLEDINELCARKGEDIHLGVECRQSNHEGELITWIQNAEPDFDGLIINAAGYTHTSVALHDALKMLKIPVIEVHLSDPKKREPFRHNSYIESVAAQTISGHGADGYTMALDVLKKLIG